MSAPTDSVEVNGLTEETTVADGDLIHINDVSNSNASRKMTKKNFVSGIVNADIAAGAAIASTKLSGVTTPSSTDTFTNKTIDADGTGNSITNIDVPEIQSGSNILIVGLELIIDGGGSAITTGEKGHIEVPFDCTIDRVTMLADQSTTTTIDIWKVAYASFPPADGNSITASAVPTITADTDSQDSTLTGWTTTITAGDILAFNVDSNNNATRVTISLKVTKTE